MGTEQQPILEWIALTPEWVEGGHAPIFERIIKAFDSIKAEYEKGGQTARLLREHGLDGWPHSLTWVCWDPLTEQIDGFFTVGKTRVDQFDLGDAQLDLKPASEIRNLRRNARARLSEDELVKKAIALATRPWLEIDVDSVVVLLDPMGAKLKQTHDFWFQTVDKKYLWARFFLEKDGPKARKPDR